MLGLNNTQPLWVILCHLSEKRRKEIVEMKERDSITFKVYLSMSFSGAVLAKVRVSATISAPYQSFTTSGPLRTHITRNMNCCLMNLVEKKKTQKKQHKK